MTELLSGKKASVDVILCYVQEGENKKTISH